MTAFEKYLLGLHPLQAAEHIRDCLMYGPRDNQAWDLIEKINGENWSCPFKDMPNYILNTVLELHKLNEESNNVNHR